MLPTLVLVGSFALTPTPLKLDHRSTVQPIVEARRAALAPQVVSLSAVLATVPSAAFALAGQSGPRGVSASTASESFDLGGTLINGVLTVVVLALFGFIGKFALEAAGEIGTSAVKVSEYMSQEDDEPRAQAPTGPLFDDSGTGQNDTPVTKRSKKRLVTDEEIARMAPWMAAKIDQDAIQRGKEARAKRKAAGK